MSLSDGGILFGCCALSFALGYAIGAIRVCHFVNKQLTSIGESVVTIQKHSHELQQLIARLDGKK
jgi:hypothetical protein